MKRYGVTVILAIVLIGLGLYLYLVEVPTARQQEQQKTTREALLAIEEDEVRRLTISSHEGDIVLEPREGRRQWMIIEPIQTEADAREVNALLRALVLGKVKRVIQESAEGYAQESVKDGGQGQAEALASYGLTRPSVTVTVEGQDRKETLYLGDTGPISSTLYARRASDDKILLTSLRVKDFLNKTLRTLRKKEILAIDRTRVDRLTLQGPQEHVALTRVGIGPHGTTATWKIQEPIEAPADATEIGILLMKLEQLKAIGFIDRGPGQEAVAATLTKPELTVEIHEGEDTHRLMLYQPDPSSGEAFAVTAEDRPIYRINPLTLRELSKGVFEVRDKRLLGLEKDQIVRLQVMTPSGSYALVRQNETWILEEQPTREVTPETVKLFVSRVADLPAEIRISEEETDLEQYGLQNPSAVFVATDRRGRERGRLVLGRRESGLVYAMGAGLPGIYQARYDLLTQIPSEEELLVKTEAELESSS